MLGMLLRRYRLTEVEGQDTTIKGHFVMGLEAGHYEVGFERKEK